jgi:hypothetical protein
MQQGDKDIEVGWKSPCALLLRGDVVKKAAVVTWVALLAVVFASGSHSGGFSLHTTVGGS